MALPKANRLKSRHDFQAVFRGGIRRHSLHLTLRALRPYPATDLSENTTVESLQPEDRAKQPTKIGISVSKKVSKRAVVRNRLKRRIAAALQQLLPKISPGWRLVIVVKTAVMEQECVTQQFLQELEQLLVQAEVLNGYS